MGPNNQAPLAIQIQNTPFSIGNRYRHLIGRPLFLALMKASKLKPKACTKVLTTIVHLVILTSPEIAFTGQDQEPEKPEIFSSYYSPCLFYT